MRWLPAASPLALLALLALPAVARAETYVETPALGRSAASFALLGGAPVGRRGPDERVDDRASVVGGGGTELSWGYSWESGISLAGVTGGARWSSRGPLAQTLRDRDASITEGWAGISFRHVIGGGELSPFYGGVAAVEWARVSGARTGDASGLAGAVRVGLRWHEHPWEVFGALEARRAWLSAPYDESDKLAYTRVSIVLGVGLEGAVR